MLTTFAVFGLGGTELIVVLLAVLILFGARKIPDFAKGLGQGIKEFRKASREVQDELDRATEDINNPIPPAPARTTPAPLSDPGSDAVVDEGGAEVENPVPERKSASPSTVPKS